MAATFVYPQFLDTIKRHEFSDEIVTPIQTETVTATPDSAETKKSEARKKRKEEREKKKKLEAEGKQAKKDSLEKINGQQVSLKKAETIIVKKTVIKPVVGFAPLKSTSDSHISSNTNGITYYFEQAPISVHNIEVKNIIPDSTKVVAKPSQSFFTGHELQAKSLAEAPAIAHSPFWINSFILAALVIFIWVQNSYRKRFSRIITAFFNIREFFQLVREEYTMTNGLSLVLSLVYILTASIFVYQINAYYHVFVVEMPVLFYMAIAGIITLFFLFKLFFVRTIGMIFYNKADQSLPFVYNIFLTNNMVGILLLPVSIFLAYAVNIPQQTTIFIAVIAILGLYIYRIVRALGISVSESGVSNLYFFSYLCTLDLVPFIVLLKQLMNRF